MKQNYRRIVVTLLALTLSFGMFACAGKPLPEGFVQEDVGTSAEEIVGYATMGDYDSIVGALREDLKAQRYRRFAQGKLGAGSGKSRCV